MAYCKTRNGGIPHGIPDCVILLTRFIYAVIINIGSMVAGISVEVGWSKIHG